MQITKFTHACVRIEDGDSALVLDPGGFSPEGEHDRVLDGVDTVFVTHEHADHVVPAALDTLLRQRPALQVHAPAGVTRHLTGDPDRIHTLGPGESLRVGSLEVTTHGGRHAVIHPLIELGYVDNLGCHVRADSGASAYHPGDSFAVPARPTGTLLAPIHAPWSKLSEVLDFVVAVRPARVHQVHDGLLNDRGQGLLDRHLERIAGTYGAEYERLAVGRSAPVG